MRTFLDSGVLLTALFRVKELAVISLHSVELSKQAPLG
jgi:hypothetical protein